MKRIFLMLCVLYYAQSVDAQSFGFKMVGGFNFCQIDGDQMGGYNKLGYRFGVGTFLPIKEKKQVGLEITYTLKGSRTANNPDNPPPFIVKYNYAYVEVPIFYEMEIKKFGVRVALAPGYIVSAKADRGGGFGVQDNVRKFELSGIIGANYKLNDKLSYYMHYQYSITSIINQKKPQFATFRRTGVYNNIVSAGFQLSFN